MNFFFKNQFTFRNGLKPSGIYQMFSCPRLAARQKKKLVKHIDERPKQGKGSHNGCLGKISGQAISAATGH